MIGEIFCVRRNKNKGKVNVDNVPAQNETVFFHGYLQENINYLYWKITSPVWSDVNFCLQGRDAQENILPL